MVYHDDTGYPGQHNSYYQTHHSNHRRKLPQDPFLY